jgi:hypothetical protein
MSKLNTATKATVGVKAAKAVAKRPEVLGLGAKAASKAARPAAKAAKPLAKRRIRKKAQLWSDAATAVTSTLVTYAPDAARQLGIVVEERPRKRTAPRVVVGIVIGAAGAYLLDPEQGAARRRKALALLPTS